MGTALPPPRWTLGQTHIRSARYQCWARRRARGRRSVAEEKAKKERKRREHAERSVNTFGAAVPDFCHAYKPDRQHRLRYWRYMARVLGLAYSLNGGAPEIIKGSLADTWADKPLAEINDVDVHTVVREARDRGIPGMGKFNKGKSEARGRSMHSALSLLFKWLLDERWPGVKEPLRSGLAAQAGCRARQSPQARRIALVLGGDRADRRTFRRVAQALAAHWLPARRSGRIALA